MFPAPPAPPAPPVPPVPPVPPPPPGPPGPPNMGGASNKIVIQKKPVAPLPQKLLDKSADFKAQIAATRGLTAQDITDTDAEFAPKMLQAIEEYTADKNVEYKKLMESLYTQYSKEELDDPLKPGEKIPLLTIRANPGTPTTYIKFQETMETRLSALEKQNLSLIQLLKDAEAEAKLLYDPNDPALNAQLNEAIVKAREKFDDFNFAEKEEKIKQAIQEANTKEENIFISRGGNNYTKKDVTVMGRELSNNVGKWKIAYKTNNQAQVIAQAVAKDEFEPDSPYSKFKEFIANEKISFDEAKNQEGKYTKLELLKLAMKLLPASDLDGNTTEGKITLVQNLLKSCIGLLAPKNLPTLITRLQADRPELNISPGATVKEIVEATLGYDIITKHEARLNEIKERELKAKEEAARQAAEAAKQQIVTSANIVGAGAAVAAGAIPQVGGIQRSAQELEAEAKAREAHAKEMEAHAKEMEAQARLLALQQAQQAQQAAAAAATAAEKTAALIKRGKGL